MKSAWVELVFGGGTAEAGSLKVLLSNTNLVAFSDSGLVTIEDEGLCGVGGGIAVWVREETDLLVVVAQQSENLYVVNTGDQSAKIIDYLLRSDDEDLRFLSIRESAGQSLTILYERGLVCVNSDGTLRWHRLHDDLSAMVVHLDSEVIVVETQWPAELVGRQTVYAMRDGAEVTR